MDDKLVYKIAISMLPGIGGVLARNLISYVGSIEGVFKETVQNLTKIPGIGEVNAKRIKNADVFEKAKFELEFIRKNGVSVHFYTDPTFPRRLAGCHDAPLLLFTKGEFDFNTEKVLAIVGTRNATEYGKSVCDDLISELAERYQVLIVSGLAYGIDIQSHKSALKYGLPTIGVVAHGLDKMYPSLHKSVSGKMLAHGGLVTDFPSRTKIDPPNFLRRNRIVAGIADATIVVESGEKGGALVTADIASSYHRDVFAVPGQVGAEYSKGCHKLIKQNVAALIEGANDIEYYLGWEKNKSSEPIQQKLFQDVSEEERKILELLNDRRELFIDQISSEMNYPVSKTSSILMGLEFKNLISVLPGNVYKLK